MKKIIFGVFLVFLFCFCVLGTYVVVQPCPLKKASLVIHKKYKKNKVFDMSASQYRMKYIFPKLREMFLRHGYDLATHDIHYPSNSDLVFVAYPYASSPPLSKKENAYLWLFESPIQMPMPVLPHKAERYRKIFTYNRKILNDSQYVYLPDPYQFDAWDETKADFNRKKELLVMVSRNYYSWPEKSIYFERRDLFKWFLQHHPSDIVVYGQAWERMWPELSLEQKAAFAQQHKGYAQDKDAVVTEAKFGIAYENMRYDDYVSEKIYDVMNAGSVPVYLGAPNVSEFIPQNCFIDRTKFPNNEALYQYLKNMDEETYKSYIACIREFVSRPPHRNIHDIDRAVDTIEQTIFEDKSRMCEKTQCALKRLKALFL